MLVDFLHRRIQALELNNKVLSEREVVLTTYIYELLDTDVPEEYKEVIKQEVFENKQ
tara:strand:- start:100 stop:270 length:171 start_codon:yes stop_codon:yes gene_type:complete